MDMAFTKETVMATRRIREFLDGSSTRYVTITHSPAYTAQETAKSTHTHTDVIIMRMSDYQHLVRLTPVRIAVEAAGTGLPALSI
jgi:hypothetical protein